MIYLHHLFYTALIFLSSGVLTSISLLSLFHIFALIPLITGAIKNRISRIPISAYFLIAVIFISLLSYFVNFQNINNPLKALTSLKYPIYSILCLFILPHFFKTYITPKKIRLLTNLFLISILVSTLFGILKSKFGFDILHWQKIAPSSRNPGLTGIMRYSYSLSLALSSLFLFALHFRKKYREYISHPLLLSALVIGFTGLLMSQSRGAILSFLCTIPLAFFSKRKTWGKISLVLITLILSLTAYIIIFQKTSSLRFFQKLHSPSNLIRLSQYESAILSAQEKPLLGLGPKQFAHNVKRIKKKNQIFWGDYCKKLKLKCDYSYKKPYYGFHAHNIFLEKLANTGILGLISFCLWLLFWFFEAKKRRDIIGKMAILFIINMFISGQFEYTLNGSTAFLIFFAYPLSFIPIKK